MCVNRGSLIVRLCALCFMLQWRSEVPLSLAVCLRSDKVGSYTGYALVNGQKRMVSVYGSWLTSQELMGNRLGREISMNGQGREIDGHYSGNGG